MQNSTCALPPEVLAGLMQCLLYSLDEGMHTIGSLHFLTQTSHALTGVAAISALGCLQLVLAANQSSDQGGDGAWAARGCHFPDHLQAARRSALCIVVRSVSVCIQLG